MLTRAAAGAADSMKARRDVPPFSCCAMRPPGVPVSISASEQFFLFPFVAKLMRSIALFITFAAICLSADKQTPLDRYVAAPDSAYKYQLINTIKDDRFTTYVLDMTSQ